ncbi:MAG: threonine transporter [Cycloclasticus sp. symbiont of Bathymodiolus heckerae]|nr:MAG: threonine transporter [Cycloclasticus sp. symbiont of Bathymodiolus heckerae]
MDVELIGLWLATLLPIVISPGPANILYAASGGSFGVKATVPFWLATNITSAFQTLAIGFGVGFLMANNPSIVSFLRYGGVCFILYLAFKLSKPSKTLQKDIKPLIFKYGVIVELLNMKFLIVPMIMFSQFYSPQHDGVMQVLILTGALLSLTLTSSMVWILGGKSLTLFMSEDSTQRIQGPVFGILLCITALWLLLS